MIFRGIIPSEDAIDEQYIKNLNIPAGEQMDYDEIFDKAVEQVVHTWKILGDAVYGDNKVYLTYLGDWNLDNGRDTTNSLVFWS